MAKRIDITGQTFGDWEVLEYANNRRWKCKCSCGTTKSVVGPDLRDGRSKSCGHNTTALKDLTGQRFGEWEVLNYAGNMAWLCRCSCGLEREVNGVRLREGTSKSCGHNSTAFKDLNGMIFSDWTVIKYIGNHYWLCQCNCGKTSHVWGASLRNGKSKSCGHNTNELKDITGNTFGDWIVVNYVGNNKWNCECSCGTERTMRSKELTSGRTKSCGHSTTALKDLIGKRFGKLEAIEYTGDFKWLCRCECRNEKIIHGHSLRRGITTSCGCTTLEARKESLLKIYGVSHQSHIKSGRTQEQVGMTESSESLKEILTNFYNMHGRKPKTIEVSNIIGIQAAKTLLYIHEYMLEKHVDIGTFTSSFEDELCKLFPTEHRGNREILEGKEIDLYYTDSKLGVEFNGSYWHSELYKEKNYHLNKTIAANYNGIRLIHIFEYEWDDADLKDKLLRLLNGIINKEKRHKVYARNCMVKEIDSSDSGLFLTAHHLQGNTGSSIRLGIYNCEKLLGVMTFGKPRFDKLHQYELIRLAFDSDYTIVGGAEKLFSFFLKKYNPDNIISYCEVSKFTGGVYGRLGFKLDKLSEPNYVWYSLNGDKTTFNRYQTQKHKLIELGIGNMGQTEVDIMRELNYIRVYDCGNAKYIWKKININK